MMGYACFLDGDLIQVFMNEEHAAKWGRDSEDVWNGHHCSTCTCHKGSERVIEIKEVNIRSEYPG